MRCLEKLSTRVKPVASAPDVWSRCKTVATWAGVRWYLWLFQMPLDMYDYNQYMALCVTEDISQPGVSNDKQQLASNYQARGAR